MRRRLSGQITVFAALSFMLIVTLITACIYSAVQANGFAQIDMATRLSVESAFAGYSTVLMSEFDIMAVEQDKLSGNILRYYAKNNIEGICGDGIEYVYGSFDNRVSMVAQGGVGVEKQILKYMNVGIYSDVLAKFLDIEKETKKAEIVTGIADEILECEKVVSESDSIIYEVIELVEGIKTTKNGVVSSRGQAVATGDYFAKSVIMAPLSKDNAAIEPDAVYNAVSDMATKYVNVYELLDNMLEYAEVYDGLQKNDEGKAEGDVATSCEEGYKKAYQIISMSIAGAISKSVDALEKLSRYESKLKECKTAFDKCDDSVQSNKDVLGEEMSNTLSSDVNSMKNTNQYTGARICNAAYMKVALEHNVQILKNAQNAIKKLDVSLDKKNYGYVERTITETKGCFKGLSNKLLKFNYDYVSFEEGAGMKAIETLKNTLANGLGGLVLADKEVSQCSISYDNLASSHKGLAPGSDNGVVEQVKNLALINEYIIERFPSATDYEEPQDDKGIGEEGKKTEQWCELNYVVEYILCGQNSDRENLNSVLLQMIAIREGINMAYLIMDGEKKQEALTLATSLVGATGNGAIVKVAQYLILAVWALGESICDLQELLDKEAVPIVKTKENWKLSLGNLLIMNFSVERKEDKGSNDKQGLTDMYYEDYLRMLLLAKNADDKRFGIMDAMELRVIALGQKDFRLRNYMWSAAGVVTLRYSSTGEYYKREISYSYV